MTRALLLATGLILAASSAILVAPVAGGGPEQTTERHTTEHAEGWLEWIDHAWHELENGSVRTYIALGVLVAAISAVGAFVIRPIAYLVLGRKK